MNSIPRDGPAADGEPIQPVGPLNSSAQRQPIPQQIKNLVRAAAPPSPEILVQERASRPHNPCAQRHARTHRVRAVYTPTPRGSLSAAPQSPHLHRTVVPWLCNWCTATRSAPRVTMRIQCDACGGAAATVVCCADEAALCARCDVEIHAANKLAGKHQRLPLDCGDSTTAPLPRCDVCQERPAFVFCVEDRALLCRDCDEPIHVPGTLSGNHQRFLATGIRVGFSSVCSASAGSLSSPSGSSKPSSASSGAADKAPDAQEVPSSPFLPLSGWAVEDLLQLSDYESSDKKDSPLGFKELEWFADIDLFHAHDAPAPANTAAEVPELFAKPQPPSADAGFYKTTSARQSKKPRLELPDDEEDYFIVPDLG